MEQTKSKKKRNIIIGTILIILVVIGVSYAYWSITHTQTNTNVVKTGCLNITFTSGSGISMNNTLPITDIEGRTTTPYHFTITNTCNSPASYQINLEKLNTSTLASEYVKAVLNKQGPRLLTNYDEVETTISTATNSYKLYKGTLQPLETKEYDLRIWMDYATTTLQGSGKSFSSKIVIITVPKIELPVLMVASSSTTAFFNGKLSIVKNEVETITFMNTKEVPLDALGSADVSQKQDGSVMAWYKTAASGTPGMYDVWIGGNGGVSANSNSSYLFDYLLNLTSIDFTYFDESTATNMGSMFENAGYNSTSFTLDLSNWDVSNVINMSNMFSQAGCNSTLFDLNLRNWDVSKVIAMQGMFQFAGYNSTTFILDLSAWDVSSVENMSSMFSNAGYYSISFTLGDLSNWDVSSVEDMNGMFYCAGHNGTTFTLDLSNWDVSNVTDMDLMFMGTQSLTELHLEDWTIPTATNAYMFQVSNNSLKIYVKNPSLGTWLSSSTNFPSGAQIILVP